MPASRILSCCYFVVLAGLPVWAAEKVASPHPEWANLAAGRAVQLNSPPNYPEVTDAGDAMQLTDGAFSSATPMWYDKAAVGWVGANLVTFTIDLGAVRPIRGAALHMAAGQAGVEWPDSIQVYVSQTGDKFSPVGDLMDMLAKRPPDKGYAALWLTADKLETHGRYVRFICSPVNLGNGSYIFIDEVEIYRGQDDWLKRPLAAADAPSQWRADWGRIKWRDHHNAVPQSERPVRITLVDGASEQPEALPPHQAVVDKAGVTFAVNGEAGKPRSMSWTGSLGQLISTARCRWAMLSFQAQGIRRTHEPFPLVLLQGVSDQAGASDAVLLEANMALNDGVMHTLVRPLPEGFSVQRIKVALTTQDDQARLTLERLELLESVPEVFGSEITSNAAAAPGGFIPAELGAVLNGNLSGWFDRVLAQHKVALDGARFLKPGPVTVSGAPFVIAAGEKNLAAMPESKESQEQVEFLGHKIYKKDIAPESRHDTLSVEVDAQAREAFLLLALSANAIQPRGGIPHGPLRLDDIETISVELTYDRGENETAFPYSLADDGCYVPARELGAYAVAVDPARRLKRITLHNRHFGPCFALAGLTFNTSDKPLVPELAAIPAPQTPRQNPRPTSRPASVVRQGDRLTVSNSWHEYDFDLAKGFVLDRLVNRWNESAKVQLSHSSGLRVRVGDTVYTGRCFKAEVVRTSPAEAELKLTSVRKELPLELHVKITADDSPELRFAVQAVNRGDKPLAAEVCLPAIADLAIGDIAQTRVFFPQYRNVDTGRPIALRAPYGPEFPAQFMDVYSRPAGVGLMIRTDNREYRMADFALRRDTAGVSGGVCWPAEHNELAPGASRSHPPVSLIVHDGDWHAAFELYRDWVRSWYKPYKAQDKDYFLNAWDLTCYRPSDKISWADTHTPPIITADRKRFLWEETFTYEKQYLGHVPDLIHFFNWNHNDKLHINEWGVHATPRSYEQVGGLEFFRRGIAEVQTKWNRPLSLYVLADRFRMSSMPDQALAKELADTAAGKDMDNDASAALRGAGADGIIYPACGHPGWVEFCVNDIAKMQRDTGCMIVYVDVFPYFSHLRGYKGTTPRQAELMVLKKLRELLPADVALWSEYGCTDVSSQYADGALQYYFLDLSQVFARRYNASDRSDDLFAEMPLNILRYVLPRYRSIGLPGYIESGAKPGQVDALFVNGEVFHEDTWRLHRSRIRARINRSYVVKHQYADCFGTENPEPQVPTAAGGITANLFAGRDRRLWTLYNGRPRTYSGVVLSVPQQPGARYRDAWNDRELTPSIENGMARIAVSLDPQQPGCVVQDWSK